MLRKPGVFNGYIASSPTLGWCPDVLEKEMSGFFRGLKRKIYLFIIYGDKDPLLVTRFVDVFGGQLLRKQKALGLDWPVFAVREVENTTHIPPTSLLEGLSFIFR